MLIVQDKFPKKWDNNAYSILLFLNCVSIIIYVFLAQFFLWLLLYT